MGTAMLDPEDSFTALFAIGQLLHSFWLFSHCVHEPWKEVYRCPA